MLVYGNLLNGTPLQFGQLFYRFANRHHCRHGKMLWNIQQRLNIRLTCHRQCGDGAAKAGLTDTQQDIPGKRINRSTTDNADPVEILVH